MRTRRREFLTSVPAILWPGAPAWSQAGRAPRIGYLLNARPDLSGPLDQAFLEGLRALGYVVGGNVMLEHRSAAVGDARRLRDAAAALVRQNPDVIVASSTASIRALKRETRTIPIVMAASSDPVATGLVASLPKPGGNVTGMTLLSNDLAQKRLQIVRELLPRATRIAMLAQKTPDALREAGAKDPSELLIAELSAAAKDVRIEMIVELCERAEDLAAAFAAFGRRRPDGLLVQLGPLSFDSRARIVELAAAQRLPDVYEIRAFVDAGGLASYGPDFPAMYRRAATFVDRVLRGAKPAEMAIEQPSRYELVVSAKTAATLGMALPRALLVRADEVLR
jgi:putative ABC transport system substrate-binding protein